MKIQKYVKDKQNKYRVIVDNEEYVLYDDVIVKYGLILKSDIDEKTFLEILTLNDELKSYYESIKYINKKLRSELEISEYLAKKGVANSIINKTIKRLKDNQFLNDDIYFKAYLNDQINLTNNGPRKITNALVKLGFSESQIKNRLADIDYHIWNEKISNYIERKIKLNHNSSSNALKMKITNDLINLGYDKEDILDILNKYSISDEDALKKEYLKAKRTLEKKYTGYELKQKIREKLYRKGFNVYNIEEYEDEE